jgi:hypothetical protein
MSRNGDKRPDGAPVAVFARRIGMANIPRRGLPVRAVTIVLILAACGAVTASLGRNCFGFCGTVSRVSVLGPLLVSRDERTISIAGPGPCTGSVSLSAVERPDRVIVKATWTGPAHPPTCTGAMGMSSWSTRLRAPVGTRSVIDAATGRPAVWIGGPNLLDPGYIPAGFTLDQLSTMSPPLIDRSTDAPCYTREYLAGTMPHYRELFIGECPGTFVTTRSTDPQVTIQDGVAVAGTTGQIRAVNATDGWHAVFWVRGDWTFMVASTGEDAPLPDGTLLAVADALA